MGEPCGICHRKITVVAAWLPYRETIAHVECVMAEFGSWCSARNLPTNDETHRAWLMWLEDDAA